MKFDINTFRDYYDLIDVFVEMGHENIKNARNWLEEAKLQKATTPEQIEQANEIIQQTHQRNEDINMFARRIKQSIQQFSYLCLDNSIPVNGVEDAQFEEVKPETTSTPNPETISPAGQEV